MCVYEKYNISTQNIKKNILYIENGDTRIKMWWPCQKIINGYLFSSSTKQIKSFYFWIFWKILGNFNFELSKVQIIDPICYH